MDTEILSGKKIYSHMQVTEGKQHNIRLELFTSKFFVTPKPKTSLLEWFPCQRETFLCQWERITPRIIQTPALQSSDCTWVNISVQLHFLSSKHLESVLLKRNKHKHTQMSTVLGSNNPCGERVVYIYVGVHVCGHAWESKMSFIFVLNPT